MKTTVLPRLAFLGGLVLASVGLLWLSTLLPEGAARSVLALLGLLGVIVLPFAALLIVAEIVAPLEPPASEAAEDSPAPATPPRPLRMPRSSRGRGRRAA